MTTPSDMEQRISNILAFEAQYLEDKFVASGLVETPAQATELFSELKKYLVLGMMSAGPMPMISALVDAAWHQFILYTTEYERFCQELFGSYQHHEPRPPRELGAARDPARDAVTTATFVDAYHKQFGPLPELWHNELTLRPDTRLVHRDRREQMHVEVEGTQAVLIRRGDAREVVCRANLRARDALAFIATKPMFLVRELVGLRDDRERLSLVSPLVRFDILHIAP